MKKLLGGGGIAAVLLVCLALLWAAPANAWWVFGDKDKNVGTISRDAGPVGIKDSVKTINLDQLRSSEKALDEKIKGMFQLTDCQKAFGEYKRIFETYIAKVRLCNDAEEAKKTMLKEAAIRWRLFDMRFANELNEMDSGCRNRSMALIERFMDEAKAAKDAAQDEYWDLRDECFSDGPSVDSLQNAVQEAEGIVCDRCDNDWPVNIAPAGDPCRLHSHEDEDIEPPSSED